MLPTRRLEGIGAPPMRLPGRVKIVEVGPRDGLQNEPGTLPAAVKIQFIDRLTEAGFKAIEAGSFVSAKWVPQMADTAEVLAGITRKPGVTYAVLTPNLEGFKQALKAGADEVAVFAAASETFSQRNTNASIAAVLDRHAEVCRAAREQGIRVRGYVSCVLGCPYEGDVDLAAVASIAGRLRDLGCYEIALGDTIGVGTPGRAQHLIDVVARVVPVEHLAVHFHDTFGQALANILAALETGVAVVDSAVAGLGGCPYAQGASGNVATEDVLYMLAGLDIETGIDLAAAIAAGGDICDALERPSMSKVARAMRVTFDRGGRAR